MSENVFQDLMIEQGIELLSEKRLSKYTSFKIGGEADFIVKPKSITDVTAVVNRALEAGIPYFFMGNGSNLLVSDDGYRGIIILTNGLNEITVKDNIVSCQSGATLASLCSFALENELSGLEFAFGIPGSVGGGIYMNAGAYGGEIKDVLISCTYLNQECELLTLKSEELDFSYRHSFFTDKGYFIVSGEFELKKDSSVQIKAGMDDYLNRRKTKQPLEYPSCGSTFKRPQNGYASALIDECGLKGYRIGGAMVSTKHAGFIINYSNATCSDVLELIAYIQKTVFDKKGIMLECEVKQL